MFMARWLWWGEVIVHRHGWASVLVLSTAKTGRRQQYINKTNFNPQRHRQYHPQTELKPATYIMKRSRFFPAVCSCTKSADQLFRTCIDMAVTAAEKLGRGHSEKTFENFMVDKLYEARIPALRQQTYFSHVDGKTYPVGIVDIEVDKSVILELKANHNAITEDFKTQARRYLRSAREKYPQNELIAGVLLFTKSGEVLYWRVKSRPVKSCVDAPSAAPGEDATGCEG